MTKAHIASKHSWVSTKVNVCAWTNCFLTWKGQATIVKELVYSSKISTFVDKVVDRQPEHNVSISKSFIFAPTE